MDPDRSTRSPAAEVDGPPAVPSSSITVSDAGGTTVVHVRGDIDAVAAPALRASLLDVIASATGTVRVDMRDVTFLDSVGISVLVTAYNAAEDASVDFELASVPPSSLRVLEITRLTEVLTIVA